MHLQEIDYKKIGMRIRRARKEKGWSQEVLAKKCGISMSFMGHIERGTRVMSLETFAGICTVLNLDADGLLWGTFHPSGSCMAEAGKPQDGNSYAMYIRIMESLAEILNTAQGTAGT